MHSYFHVTCVYFQFAVHAQNFENYEIPEHAQVCV